MAKSENISTNAIDQVSQNIDNSFLCVYINNFVKKFRNYNKDEYIVTISGIKKFIPKDDKNFNWLIEQLKENNFNIEFKGDEESINEIDINCNNITKNTSINFKYQIHYLPTIVELSSKTDIHLVAIIITKIVAQIISKLKTLYKAIVLDLDETLWTGTLSEDGIENIIANMNSKKAIPFIQFMNFVKVLGAELGIFIAISSRNDYKIVEALIDKLDIYIFPLKNQIDCIIANNNDKSENIRIISEQLSILPNSIVFIDDNQIVRDEVNKKWKEIFVPEWENHTDLVTMLIAGCIFEREGLSINSQNRRKQNKMIQTERIQNSMPKLNIKIFNDDQHSESIKLYSKSNQFKFSLNDDNFNDEAESLYFELIRENGENLGICSALTFSRINNFLHINNWAISCRYFEIGLEEFILLYLQKIAYQNKIFFDHAHTEYNQKVREMIAKYSDAFKENHKKCTIEINLTKATLYTFNKNTNLSII